MRRSPTIRRLLAASLLAAVASGPLAGCGSEPGGSGTADDPLEVVASFYPLQWMAQKVGGDRVEVSSLTKPGAEPHDLELTPRDVGAIQDADAVAFLSEFQPGVDTAVVESAGEVFDARDATELEALDASQREPEQHEEEEEEGGEEHDHDHDAYEVGTTDPHFWLDPTRMAEVATAFADTLATADPAHAADYRANAEALSTELAELDGELEAGLADCERTDLVTSHDAFGYLARRYGLEQVGITGLTPEADPSPQDVAEVADFVEEHDVTTIYFETLTSPAVAETLASETGASTAVLDPLEGLTDESDGSDYLEVMRSNLATLQAGQGCT
ncbi:metal ABC transporter substrate-binding protein [Aquihabitans daechungensis]|uniref:metal ABC transporter substrate-binding protein n=1 Tax=Aquihabitans daechungensis TaxID=1052257 RepID=UPI003BA265B1